MKIWVGDTFCKNSGSWEERTQKAHERMQFAAKKAGENKQALQEMNVYQEDKWARYNNGKDQQIAPVGLGY